jgi:hypothetical protein
MQIRRGEWSRHIDCTLQRRMRASMEFKNEGKYLARKPELARCEQCGELLPRERTTGSTRARRCADCTFDFPCTD